jgi:hypothetical protein
MKNVILVLVSACLMLSCNSKKTETVNAQDTVKIDTVTKAEVPKLAFNTLDGYTIKKNVPLPGNVNFMIFNSKDEFDRIFTAEASAAPIDFLINHTVAISCSATDIKTSIDIEKVELGENTINVFAKITRGEKQNAKSIPARVFAIEKRDGMVSLDFYLNGKMASSLMLGVQ